MPLRSHPKVAPEHNATPYFRASLAEELRELRKLAKDRRTASLALFRNSTKHSALAKN
jgi:hypothetical protein